MKKILTVLFAVPGNGSSTQCSVEPNGRDLENMVHLIGQRLSVKRTIFVQNGDRRSAGNQKNLDAAGLQQISFWNAGAPGYRWQEMIAKVWTTDLTSNGILAQMLLSTAIYDATVAAWDTKYAFNRPRPYITDKRIKLYVPKPESPSYPCEHSIAAGAAVTIIGNSFLNFLIQQIGWQNKR